MQETDKQQSGTSATRFSALAESARGRVMLRVREGKSVLRKVVGKPAQPAKNAAAQEKLPAQSSSELPEEAKPATGKELAPELLPTISVVIPTYKKNDLIGEAIRSCLEQDYPKEKIEIIVSVNGKDAGYAAWLTEEYKAYPQVRVVYTPVAGVSAGRNYGKRFVRTEFTTYLDDDDYFTKGYLKELAGYIADDITVVCGWQLDEAPDGTRIENPYFKEILQKYGGYVHETPWKLAPLFSVPWMKLYRTSQLQNVWGDFDETLFHTEDTVFWVENIHKPMGKTAVVALGSGEAYIRRLQEDSLSRPSRERLFDVFATDRIALIHRLTGNLLQEDQPAEYKAFVRGKIDAMNNQMYRYYLDCEADGKQRVLDLVRKNDEMFLNKSRFGLTKAIALCHDFTQLKNAFGYGESKRLRQISDYAGKILNWTVIRGSGKVDVLWERYFAKYQYTDKQIIPGGKWSSEEKQTEWAEKAFAQCQDIEAAYIYSASGSPGSHAAALKYKRTHPETLWIAEFAQPLYMDANNCPREEPFWRELETAILREADKIIFISEDQKDYILKHNPADISDKALIWSYPVTDAAYGKIIPVNYPTDAAAINIGYFGALDKRKIADELLILMTNPGVELHIFTEQGQEFAEILAQASGRIHIRTPVSYLEMLSIARKMDYLYLSDIPFKGPYSPYLPERLADYLSAKIPVIAKVYPNTHMSKLEHPLLIKVQNITVPFAAKLKKQDK